ncbi:MAG TPA: IPT/TIG domain-containing protein, partial [Candidatus Angelobacter sp.]
MQWPVNGPVTYAYDELGRLVAVFDTSGNAAAYRYDAVGNILSITRYTSGQIAIISFTPAHGASGAAVKISGTGFSATANQNSVQFNGAAAVITSATNTELDVLVPDGASTGPITVTSPLGSATSATNFTPTAQSAVPTITGFTPTMGLQGTSVTITGTNFDTNPAYDRSRFNVSSAIVTGATASALTATFPSGGTSGHASVTTSAGTATSTGDFFTPFGTHGVADIAYTGRISIGETANMTLNAPQKIGLLLFDGNQGQHISLQWTSTVGSCSLYLFAPNGSQINLTGFNGTGIASTSCAGASGGSSGNIDNVQLAGAGTYMIGVEDLTTSGTVTVTLGDVSDVTAPITIDGPPVTVATTHAGQDARLSFSAQAGQRVVLQVSNVTNGATVFLLGPTGESIASLGVLNSAGQIFFMDTQLLSTAGQYTLWLKHSGTNIGSTTLQLNSVPPDFTAPLTINGPSVRIPASGNTAVGQNALLSLTAAAGQKFSITSSNGTYPNGLCNVAVTNSNGSVLGLGNCGGAAGYTDTVTAPVAGTYSILVNPSGMTTGNVTLAVSDDSDVTGTIAIDGPPVTTTTTVVGQDARLTFTANAGQRVVLQVNNVSNPTAGVYLLKPDGTIQSSIAISNSAGQIWFMDTQALTTAGTYTLWIAHIGTNVGSETLQLNSVPADFTAPITMGGAAVRVPSTGNTALGQNANLTFTATAGQKVSVSTSGGTYSSCVMYIRDASGSNLLSGSCSGATGFIDSTSLTAGGSYSVFLDPQGIATGTATVSLNNTADLSGTIAIDGSPVTATTNIAGQDARVTFSATAGQRVVLRISSVTNPNFSVYLLKPDSTTQTSMGIVNGGGQTWFIDTQVLATSGTYTIWIAHAGTNVGGETLLLNSVPDDFTASITVGGATVRVPTSGNNALGQNASLAFNATAGQNINIYLSSSTYSPSAGCLLTVKDPSGNSVTSTYCGSGANSPIFVTAPSAGMYTIFLDPQGMAVGAVTVGLNANNDVTGTVSIDGSPVTTTTTAAGQDARLTFNGSAGQHIVVRVTGVTNPSATLILVRPDNTNQASISIGNSPVGQTWFMDTQTLASTGSYTLWIQHSGTNIGSATSQLSSVPADFTGSITPGGAAVRVPASGDTAVGQNGILTFTGSANQKVSMSVSNGTYSPLTNCVVSLRNAGGANLTSGYCGNGASSFIDTITLSSAGVYSAFVDPQGIATGNTTIQVNDSSDITGVIGTDGTPVTTTTGIGQDARYTFNATTGQRVALRVTGVTEPSATVFILKPDGSTQASVNINNNPAGQLFFIDTQTLAAAGTYTVWVRHSVANVGTATLQLDSVPADYTASLTPGTAAQVPATGNLAIGQNARMTFIGTAGFQINAQFSNNTIGPVTVTVLKTDGVTTLSSLSSSAPSFNFLMAMLPSTGTYTIVVDPTGVASGSITLLLTQVGGSNPLPNRTGNVVNPASPLSQDLVGLFLMNEGTGSNDKDLVDGHSASFAGSTLPAWNTSDPSVAFTGTTASLSSYLDAGTDLTFDQLPTNKMTVVGKIFLNS